MPRNDLKACTTVLARLPQELADQVKQYARQHRLSVSELIRDGLEMRLETAVPGRSTGRSTDDEREELHEVFPTAASIPRSTAKVLPGYTWPPQPLSAPEGKGHTEVLQDAARTLPSIEEGLPGNTSLLPQPNTQGMPSVLPLETSPGLPSGEGMTEVLPQDSPGPQVHQRYQQPETRPTFDTARYFLGELCTAHHRYQGQEQSLRYRAGNQNCVTCRRERNARYNARKRERQAWQQTTPQRS